MPTRKTGLRRTALVRRNPLRARRPRRPTGPDMAVVVAVLLRASSRDGRPRCEVCGDLLTGARGFGWSLHHRRGRDGSAGEHAAENLLAVDGASNVDRCHGVIHSNRRRAEANGWSITRNAPIGGAPVDPLTVAVLVDNGQRRVFLTAAGFYVEEASDAA